MSKATEAQILQELRDIEAILEDHPGGLSRSELEGLLRERYGRDIPPRKLRRRLARLADEGRVTPEGLKKGRRYTLARSGEDMPPAVGTDEAPEPAAAATADTGIPLTPESLALQRRVRLPRQQRDPCTYRREFLEDYVPGETWYLSKTIRGELLAIGETPDPERPAGTYARDILDRLLIALSWASSRLEGNTYSRLDTQNLLEHGIHAEGKSQQEAQMILNHRAAIRMLVDHVDAMDLDRRTLLGLHAALAENLVADPGEEGALRQRPVDISGTVYTPIAIPQVIRECFDLALARVREIPDPFEQAFFVMVHIPYLQPFVDVNKRTSRIAANIPFIKGNFCPLSFVDVPHETYIEATIGVYERRQINLLRDLFVWAYRRSCEQYRVVRETLGEPDTVRFRYRDQLAEVVRDTVLTRSPLRRSHLRTWAEGHDVDEEDREAFVDRAMEILLNLTEGVAGRYGLSLEDVDAWRASFPADPGR